MAGGRSAKKKIDVEERKNKALELRKMGASYRAIASAIAKDFGIPKYSYSQAHRDVEEALKELREQTSLNAQEYVRLELERLDTAMVAIAQQVRQGNHGAIDRWLKIMERRAKYLGLDLQQDTDNRKDIQISLVHTHAAPTDANSLSDPS